MELYGNGSRAAYVKTKEYRSRTGGVCPNLDVYGLKTIAKWTTQDRLMEQRVRPSPLVLYPTGQLKVYTEKYRVQVSRSKVWTRNPNYCESRSWYYTEMPTSSLLAYGQAPDPQWINALRLTVKEHGQVSLGETTFEFRETADMFAKAGRAVKDAWMKYRAGRRILRKLVASDIAAAELTASFGINPMLGVLKDSYDVLHQRLVEPILTRHVITRSASTSKTFRLPGRVTGDDRVDWKRRRRAVFWLAYQYPESRFTMGNPLEVAWELVPFSWLIDGLVDVGSYLASLDYLGDKYLQCVGTMTETDRVSHVYRSLYSTAYEVVTPGTGIYKSHRRYAYGDLPDVQLPTYRPSRSWHKIMHAISALTLIHSGGVRRNKAFDSNSRPLLQL